MDINSVPRFRTTDDRKPQPGQPVNRHDLANAVHDRAARRRLLTWLEIQLAHDTLLRRQNWPVGVAALGLAAATTLVLWTLGAFATAIVDAATTGGRHTGLWLRDGGLVNMITGPVRAWLDAHTAGLPATSTDLGLIWAGIAAVLYLVALTRSVYARIAWALVGAATIAAAYAGADTTGAAAAAGTTAAVWLLLSLPVYRRRRRTRRPATDSY